MGPRCGAPRRRRRRAPLAAPLAALPALHSSGGALHVNLTVVAAQLSSGSSFALSTRAYAWASGGRVGGPALSGPTLHVLPGDTLTVTLSNRLAQTTARMRPGR